MPDQTNFFPTKFSGYYVSRSGKVFRDPIKRDHTDQLVEVSEHLRGGAYTNQYSAVNISLKEHGKFYKQIRYYVHRLVGETLIENPHNLTEINHIDGDKLNNSVDNLEWVTKSQNFSHRKQRRDSNGRMV